MGSPPRLGAVNAALISVYFGPVWGRDALRALTSPFYGFQDRAHAVAASYYRALFDFGLDGLVRTASLLSGLKFVIAIGFFAYLIDFARGLAVGREPNRETLDTVLVLAAVAIMFSAWPALGSGDGDLIRLYATQFLLLTGAMIVIVLERQTFAERPSNEGAERAPVPSAARERQPRASLAELTAPTG